VDRLYKAYKQWHIYLDDVLCSVDLTSVTTMMNFSILLFLLNFASVAVAHGYVKWIGVDNKLCVFRLVNHVLTTKLIVGQVSRFQSVGENVGF
jgi:hypothetical protein